MDELSSFSFHYNPTNSPSATEPTVSPAPTVTAQPTSSTLVPTAPPGSIPTTAQPTTHGDNSSNPPNTVVPSLPTAEPTSAAPTMTAQPTVTRTPTTAPSTAPLNPTDTNSIVFTCDEEGQVALATPPFGTVTSIPFDLGYLVETQVSFESFQQPLNDRILSDAVQGALNCGPGIFETSTTPAVPIETIPTGEACISVISVCTVLEASFNIAVEDNVAPDATAFLGYVRLSNEMTSYPAGLTGVDRVEYLRPVLFPPVLDEETQPPAGIVGNEGNSVSVSPYTLGAVLAVCIGGLTALGVWARNRRRRNEQHMLLLEDMSGAEEMVEGEAA